MSFQLEGSAIGTVKGGTLLGLMLLILTVLMVADDSRAAGDLKLRITQVELNLPDLRLFVELENVNMDNTKLKKNLSIKINDTPVQITDIQSVKQGNRVAVSLLGDQGEIKQGAKFTATPAAENTGGLNISKIYERAIMELW